MQTKSIFNYPVSYGFLPVAVKKCLTLEYLFFFRSTSQQSIVVQLARKITSFLCYMAGGIEGHQKLNAKNPPLVLK